MAIPLAVAATLAGGTSFFGIGKGLSQKREGKKLREQAMKELKARPYKVPGELEDIVSRYGAMAEGDMPGAAEARARLSATTGRGVTRAREAARSASDVLGATTELYSNELAQQEAIDQQERLYRQQMKEAQMQAMGAMAPYRERAWQYNVYEPARAKLAAASQFQAAGEQNIAQGISDISRMGMQFATGGFGGGGMAGGAPTVSQPMMQASQMTPQFQQMAEQRAMQTSGFNPNLMLRY